ncbi:MAG: isoamylase, partial [Treponema sp.]|nr:isoamylase [Treponema sp.]
MKTIMAVLLILGAGFLWAADTESYEFIDHLLRLTGPGTPEPYEDAVIFTASAASRRVGIAFAHEGFSKVHWFRKLLVPQDPGDASIPKGGKTPDPYRDTGILFHVQEVPENTEELEYRL